MTRVPLLVVTLLLSFASTTCAGLKPGNDRLAALRSEAQLGNPNSQVKLGMVYQFGRGVETDIDLARHWYLQAANQNHRVAQFNLAAIYHEQGKYKQAIPWFQRSAGAGLAQAQHALSIIYRKGRGVSVDLEKSFHWCRLAAERGLADAEYGLGVAFDRGRGTSQDKAMAVHWWRKAAKQGHVDAQYNLGFSYQFGQGIGVDLAEAARWYERAAQQGHADAQFNLGALYANGKGIDQDLPKALLWLRMAADQGIVAAQENVKRLRTYMDDHEIRDVKRGTAVRSVNLKSSARSTRVVSKNVISVTIQFVAPSPATRSYIDSGVTLAASRP